MECKYCQKSCKNDNSLTNHQRLCKLNPDREKSNFIEYAQKIKVGLIVKKNTNQYTKAKLEGRTYVISQETRDKISKSSRLFKHSEESKQKLSISMRKAVLKNPDSYTASNVSGRTPIIFYNGIKLKGSWEVETAKWLDRQQVKWTNFVRGFDYIWENSIHTYFPDFYLMEYNVYIEVKGYERDRDRAKWGVVKNLIVLKKQEIARIKKDELEIKELIGPLSAFAHNE